MLTTAELTQMRADAAEALPDTCDIQTKAVVSDGQGGSTEAYTTTASSVPCRVKVEKPGLNENTAQNRAQTDRDAVVTFAHDRTINVTDRIVWNTRTFEVVSPLANSWQVHLQVACVEIV